MIEVTDLQILGNINGEKSYNDLNKPFQRLLKNIQEYLNLKPFHENVQIMITKDKRMNLSKSEDIFSIGVNRHRQDKVLIIEIGENFSRFVDFILIREIYELFVPDSLKAHEMIHIIVNKIVMIHLAKSSLLNEWRSLIRIKLEDYDLLSIGVTRLFESDRLEKFLKSSSTETPLDPIQFFFKYIRENISIIKEKIDNIYEIFFQEFTCHIFQSENGEEIVESIRCLIKIFNNVKKYSEILRYKDYFLEFKESGKLETNLSQRKFIMNIDWIKKRSYIAPSYQLNWKAINVCLLSIFLRFNPLLNKTKINTFIDQLPFFVSPKISYDSFAVDLSGYIVIPNVYLNDFQRFIEKLEDFGYLIKHHCLVWDINKHNVNLNYLREYLKKHRIINPDHSQYNEKNEIEFTTDLGGKYCRNELSLLDFLVLDRIRFVSVAGLGFERRNYTLNEIKSDLINEIIAERAQIKNLKKHLKIFRDSINLSTEFLQFLEVNKKFGFFYIKSMLENSLTLSKLIERVVKKNPHIRSYSQFQDFVRSKPISQLIEDNILFKNMNGKNVDFKEILILFFQSRKHYRRKIEILKRFSDLINSCYKLKIFSINSIIKIVIDQQVVTKIYKTKEAKLKKHYERWKLYKITFQEIDTVIDKFLNIDPPIIKPLLINTILFQEKDYLQLILNYSEDTLKVMEQIKKYFPRVLINSTRRLKSNKNLIFVEISTPYMTKEEKKLFYSILYNNLKEDLLYGKSYLWKGWNPALSRKTFYDFNEKHFFYTKDLYKQFFLNVRHIFGELIKPSIEKKIITQDKFWSKEKFFVRLIKAMNYHDKKENIDFSVLNLNTLLNFNKNLKKNLLNSNKFKSIKEDYFYKNYVKSIKFIPLFQHFGFQQFFLYVYPLDFESIDLRVLLSNMFQKIKYPPCIDGSNSLFIKYIMPYGFPNKKYINWLTKAKQNIREYIAFSVRKIHRIFQFHSNLDTKGWVYDPDTFKIYMQKVLFNPDYKAITPEIQIFDLEEISDSKSFTPDSSEYDYLTKIYSWHSIDLKYYLGANKYSIENHIKDLLNKGLIEPYLSLKNIGIQDTVFIILPNLKKETISLLIKVFSFFNIGFIHEIEGEFFISGFNNEIKFQNGLMIKLYFPKCELSEFERLFDLLFEYLEIDHSLILNDLVDGSNLIKSVFGNLDFLKTYNPLKNLKWNEKDKIWINHNIFSKEEGFIYPDLINKRDDQK